MRLINSLSISNQTLEKISFSLLGCILFLLLSAEKSNNMGNKMCSQIFKIEDKCQTYYLQIAKTLIFLILMIAVLLIFNVFKNDKLSFSNIIKMSILSCLLFYFLTSYEINELTINIPNKFVLLSIIYFLILLMIKIME